ncbi:DNA-directed RNA polymerase subunit omega [Candidatus Deianiraea vastatrix]|uniref:DNA-directed RNA polymerase subunit omega n=1 Tax=Candidatus Deianiraea vastatrix TaxID=2163644 RepID=A0A5B8XEK0_9RICK|nr:DNA-directed RNA polymerase subunit omega [Candidatus Deianiraea vastatrix]QED23670.1 DNA-directed RNA polymerase subunit omega [Candidatus Deianiraea vastatrix]
MSTRNTIEDCIKVVENRFELVLLASCRARELFSGAEAKIEGENAAESEMLTSLQEIAENAIDIDILRARLASGEGRGESSMAGLGSGIPEFFAEISDNDEEISKNDKHNAKIIDAGVFDKVFSGQDITSEE